MTRTEAEELARQDAMNGEKHVVPGYAEGWYEAERAEVIDRLVHERRAEMSRRGIVVPWWELYRSRP